ncbi:MAG TPA: translocation/assembly module TamB domain-containing protein [Verrucomicrobiae bacterium]|nr:translocation/assembly module TamB domain-containing protein [Verrucomicrobiae bacterium]
MTAIVLVAAGVLAVGGRALAAWVLPGVLGVAIHGNVTASAVTIGNGQIVIRDLHATKNGDPLFDAAQVRIEYSLRDLLPGSKHRFGLRAVTIDRPLFTLERREDGSYDLALGFAQSTPGAPPPGPLRVNRVPIAFTIAVHDGGLALREPHALDPQARAIDVRDVQLAGTIDTAARSHYRLSGAFADRTSRPFSVVGTIDATRGYAMNHVQAGPIPLRRLANFFINNRSAEVLAGGVRGIDIRYYALGVEPDAPIDYHLAGHVGVTGASLRLVGLAQPVTGVSGDLQLVDDQLFFQDMHASIAGIALSVTGGMFDFAAPQLDMHVAAAGDLAALRVLFAFARDQAIAGAARIGVIVDGPVSQARVRATVDAPHASYRGILFDGLHAAFAYNNSTVFLAPLEAHAQGADFVIRGALEIGDNVQSRLALHVNAPADALPYAGMLLGNEPLVGDFMLDGMDNNFYGYGALQSTRGIARMGAVAHADRGGILDVAPLWIDAGRGQLYGGYALDRKHDTSAFWIRAQHLALHTPARASFLSVAIPAMPPLDGTVDDATILGGGQSGNHALLAGSVHVRDATIAGVALNSVRATFAGTLANAAIDPIVARGPWGSLHGTGALSLSTIAVHGDYRGTLQGLRPFMGELPASGDVSGVTALALGSQGIIVQADDIVLRNANIHGIPLSRATGTLAIRGGRLRIESVRAQVASGSVVAAGPYDSGISLVASHLDGGQLRALGLPLDGGTIDAQGQLAGGSPLPAFDGGVALANGRVQHLAVAGSGLIALHGDGVHLDHVVGGVDNIYALASGDLGALTSGAPHYAISAEVPAGSLQTAIAALGINGHYSEGTFNASLRVRGAGLAPHVDGPIGVPAGSVNGLYYTDASGIIAADPSGVGVSDGTVTLATTQLAFNAAENPHLSALQVNAPSADLSDFNNFFNTGDTLNGTGSVRFDVISQAHRLSSNGEIAIAHLRYRNLPFGNTNASWSSAHNVLRGTLDVDGSIGVLHSHGSIDIAQEVDVLPRMRDSYYAVDADVTQFDLSTWIAALGYPEVAVTGRVNGSATVNGRYPLLQMRGNASMQSGTVWRLPIDKAALTFSSNGGRLTIDAFTLSAPGLTASASGSFGFSTSAPLALTLHASSNDLPQLVALLARRQLPVTGTFESTLQIGGSLASPTYEAAFNAKDAVLYGLAVPSAYGELALHGNDVVLHNAGVTLPKGSISLQGSAPIQITPFRFGPPGQPISLDVEVKGVDPSAFDALAGNGTKLGGTIDGSLAIGGTVADPRITGKFSVAKGTYASDLELTPITGVTASMTFDQTSATVDKLEAKFGTGTVSGSGHVAFGAATTYAINLKAQQAQLNFPAYGSGSFDAALALSKTNAQKDALLRGTVSLSSATIPFAAFIAATKQSAQGASLPLPLDLDIQMDIGKNVRVRGSGFGAGLDIGASGSAHLAGSLAAPTLQGTFAATNGTLTFYDRAFRIQSAKVVFNPDQGLIPTLRATATTHVSNPDPSSPFSSVDVTASVDGPVTNPKLTFTSNPSGYSNEQILAMIAPFGGVILSGQNYAPTQPGAPGAGPIPGAQPIGGTSSAITAGQEAFNIVNAQFAAGLLSPIEGALSQGLGVQNVNLTLDYYGNVGFSASRFLGKTVNFLYSATFGIPQRTSFGLELVGDRATSAQLSFFFTNGPQKLFETPIGSETSGNRLAIGLPLQGSQGFAFTFQRLFW